MVFKILPSCDWLCAATAIMALVVVMAVIEGQAQQEKIVVVETPAPAHLENMIKLSPQRRALDPRITALCVAPRAWVERGPHRNAAVLVYANQKVINYRRVHTEGGDYPVGSIFLKEKFAGLNARNPHLATRMERLDADGKIGDWAFSVISLPEGKPVPMTANEKAACADCHRNFSAPGHLSPYTTALLAGMGTNEQAEVSADDDDGSKKPK